MLEEAEQLFNVPTPPIIYVIEAVNNLPEEAVVSHAPELCHMLSNLLDDHAELINGLESLLDKLAEHYTEVEDLLDSFATKRGRTATQQLQVFNNVLAQQREQHHSLEELMASISVHLTTEELSRIKGNTVERRDIHETVTAIMEKYEELMENG